MLVKVCGIRNDHNLKFLSESSVNMIGFIFYDRSKRFFNDGNLSQEDLRFVTKKKVGVFVNADIDYIREIVNAFQLDFVQLHGEESPSLCQLIKSEGISVMKAFSVLDSLPSNLKEYEGVVDLFLFDTKGAEYGGNGVQFDWEILNEYNLNTSFLVSGGVGPTDVHKLDKIKNSKFIGVDINSRFEVEPGLKDESVLEKFLKELKQKRNDRDESYA